MLPLHKNSVGRSWISQLGIWAAVEAQCVLTLRADTKHMQLVRPTSPNRDFSHETRLRVAKMIDISGRGHDANAVGADRRPKFEPDALGPGLGALDFGGTSILQTMPFTSPLPQPISLMIVAKCAGDTTLCDSLSWGSPRFELCHGYPNHLSPHPLAPAICISAHGEGREAPAKVLRGVTRSTNTWHVYTAIFDGDRSEMCALVPPCLCSVLAFALCLPLRCVMRVRTWGCLVRCLRVFAVCHVLGIVSLPQCVSHVLLTGSTLLTTPC